MAEELSKEVQDLAKDVGETLDESNKEMTEIGEAVAEAQGEDFRAPEEYDYGDDPIRALVEKAKTNNLLTDRVAKGVEAYLAKMSKMAEEYEAIQAQVKEMTEKFDFVPKKKDEDEDDNDSGA